MKTSCELLPANNHFIQMQGLSLRDYFAGQALAGLIVVEGIAGRTDDGKGIAGDINLDAERCFTMADAMIRHSRPAIEEITTQKETTT